MLESSHKKGSSKARTSSSHFWGVGRHFIRRIKGEPRSYDRTIMITVWAYHLMEIAIEDLYEIVNELEHGQFIL